MPETIVPVQWVAQEELYYCGPAVAQMSLDGLKVAPPATPPTWQDQLWEEIQIQTGETRPNTAPPGTSPNPAYPTQKCEQCPDSSEWRCWSTSPLALQRVLNLSQNFAHFEVTTHDSEDGATTVLLDAIDKQVASPALVYGWLHWIVVHGYVFDEADPCDIGNRALNAVYIRNPQQAASVHLVTCDAWRDEYLRFVPCGEYMNKMVVIGGTPKPSPPPQPPGNVRIIDKKHRRRRLPPWVIRGAAIIPPQSALQTAEEAAAQLRRLPRWQSALKVSRPQEPLLVQRLDRADSYYYIVPYGHDQRRVITARLIVDATTNRFTEASGIENDADELPPFVDPQLETARWQGEAVEFPSLLSRVIRPGMVGRHPVLVWKPCRESASPFLPFHLLTVGDDFIYLRVDGQRFVRLTTDPV